MINLTKDDLQNANHKRRNFRSDDSFQFFMDNCYHYFNFVVSEISYIRLGDGIFYCIDIFLRSIDKMCND